MYNNFKIFLLSSITTVFAVANAAPIVGNTQLCGGFPIIMNIPRNVAFLSGGTEFEALFVAQNNVSAVCRDITVELHLFFFNDSSSNNPSLEVISTCRPSPLGDKIRVQCEAPDVSQILLDDGIVWSTVVQRGATSLLVEPFGQFNGCKPSPQLKNAQPPAARFCYSLVILPEGRKAYFMPTNNAAAEVYLRLAQSLRYFPDPNPSSAVMNLKANRLTISGANLVGENAVVMSRLYSITILFPDSTNTTCDVIYNEATNNALTCIFNASNIQWEASNKSAGGVSTLVEVGNVAVDVPTLIITSATSALQTNFSSNHRKPDRRDFVANAVQQIAMFDPTKLNQNHTENKKTTNAATTKRNQT